MISWKGMMRRAVLLNEITYIQAWMGWWMRVLPLRSSWKICANCLIVLTAWLRFSPSIDPDVSRRKPMTILRGGYLSSVPATRSGGDAIISSFPNVLPFSVRRKMSCRVFSGMKLWSRISVWTVVNELENIGVCLFGGSGDDTAIEMN